MSYVGTLGQSVIPEGFSVRWGPAGAPTDQEVLGRGCTAGAVPQGDERRVVENLIEVERNEQYERARCEQKPTAQERINCRQGVNIIFRTRKQEKQDAISAFCSARAAAASAAAYAASVEAAQAAAAEPEVDVAPVPSAAAPKDNTLLYVAIGVGVLALGVAVFR